MCIAIMSYTTENVDLIKTYHFCIGDVSHGFQAHLRVIAPASHVNIYKVNR